MVIVCPVEICKSAGTGFSLMNSVWMNQIETPNRRIATTVSTSEVLCCLDFASNLVLAIAFVSSVVDLLLKVLLVGIWWLVTSSTMTASD
jgi:hypothetical protein